MVADKLTSGVRIGQLLASEIAGNEGRLRAFSLSDADPEVEPTPDGAFAYDVVRDGALVAEAYVQPDRLQLEFVADRDAPDGEQAADEPDAPALVAAAADDAGLRVRPKAVHPPRTLVFVEDGAQVKRALSVFEALVESEKNGE
ncbi:hypothetical protein [Halorubrum sp. PV6]|uniref:hypothetical protein n=1 Tax=Halorubrum sp. PV6 TaxID=634157 RepID=UPI000F854C6E|nr:hypothetical protein [Halorubrum sp. PV6]AZQ15425.1 hypothetical protein DOS48_11595 [Halorubrum sp. PV6]